MDGNIKKILIYCAVIALIFFLFGIVSRFTSNDITPDEESVPPLVVSSSPDDTPVQSSLEEAVLEASQASHS